MWQWTNMHNTRTLKLKQQSGIQPSFILLFKLGLFLLRYVKMSFVKEAYWASKSLKSSCQKCSIICGYVLLRSLWEWVTNKGSSSHYFLTKTSHQFILHEKLKSVLCTNSIDGSIYFSCKLSFCKCPTSMPNLNKTLF